MTDLAIVHRGTLAAVREYVQHELCEMNQLEKDAFQMTQRVLTSKGKLCGYYFCIFGPRSVRLTAVWDIKKQAILFYDSLGRRSASQPVPICQ